MSPDQPGPDRDVDLPRAVALAWGVAANPQRGPKRELSIERIVDVAVALADAGGLGSVSMSAIAGELGVTPMALYRYVSAKDDLVTLMQERGIGVAPEVVRDTAAAGGWRAGLEEWSRAMTRVYLEHGWLLDIPIEGTPTTPNNLTWLETALEVLDPVPLDLHGKTAIALALIAQVRWEAHVIRGYVEAAAAAGSAPDDVDRSIERLLHSLVTPAGYPHVHAALVAGVFSADSGLDPFAFGRDRLLDGVEALLDGRARVSPVVAADPLDEAVARDPKVREAVKARRDVEKRLRDARAAERQAQDAARERAGRARR